MIMVLNFAEEDQKAHTKFVGCHDAETKPFTSKHQSEASDRDSEEKKKKKSCKVQ